MKTILLAFALLLSASSAFAQSRKLQWDQPGVTTVAQAQALVYRLQVDAAAPAIVVQTCTVAGTVVSCATPLMALGSGPHTLTLTVDNGFDMAVATISGTSPANPVSLKIVITVTVP